MEVMQLLAEEHLAKNGESDEMLKVPKKQMPLYVLAIRLARIMNSKNLRTRSDCFKAIQTDTCLPIVNGKSYLTSLLQISDRERTLADYFETMVT